MTINDSAYSFYKNVGSRLESGLTAFNEISVAVPSTQIDLKSSYPLSRLRDAVEVIDGGSVTQENGKFVVSTDSVGTSAVLFRSVERGRYVAGFDALAGLAVACPVTPIEEQDIEWGYTDFVNGFVVGLDSTGLYTAYYNDSVESPRRYTNEWSVNPFNAPINLDVTDLNVYRINFRYYGKGPFELNLLGTNGLGKGSTFFTDSTIKPNDGNPIVRDPNQPLSVRVRNNGTTTNPIDVNVVGRQFHILGDYTVNRRVTSGTRDLATVPVSATSFVPLVSLRQRTDDVAYDSIATKLAGITLLSTQNIVYQVRVYSGLATPVWESPSFSDAGVESALEFDKASTAITNGITVYEGLAAGGGTGQRSAISDINLPNIELPSGGGNIVLCARAISTGATVTATLRVSEEW